MQLYRGMDIGTAKVPPAERRGIPHHLLDVLDVTETATVASYQRDAREAIEQILARGLTPDPGRRLRPVHPVRGGRDRFPGDRSAGQGAAGGRPAAAGHRPPVRTARRAGSHRRGQHRAGQRAQDRAGPRGHRTHRPAVHRLHAAARSTSVRRRADPAGPADSGAGPAAGRPGHGDDGRRFPGRGQGPGRRLACVGASRRRGRWATPSCWPCWTGHWVSNRRSR